MKYPVGLVRSSSFWELRKKNLKVYQDAPLTTAQLAASAVPVVDLVLEGVDPVLGGEEAVELDPVAEGGAGDGRRLPSGRPDGPGGAEGLRVPPGVAGRRAELEHPQGGRVADWIWVLKVEASMFL